MTTKMNTKKTSHRALGLFAACAIVMAGLNLRPALAALGPLLDLIRTDLGLTFLDAGLATTLPIIAMGVFALCGNVVYRLGMRRGVFIGLLLVLLACILRLFVDDTLSLLASALIAGAGIGIVQVLIPGFIKRAFPDRVDRLMGLYVTAIMGGAALAAITAPAVAPALGWRGALALLGVPAVVAITAWLLSVPMDPPPARTTAIGQNTVFARSRAWTLALVFGIETGCYTLLLAWLAPYYLQLGWSPEDAGVLLAGLTVCEVIAGLMVATFAPRWSDRRIPLICFMLMGAAGFVCLIVAPQSLAWVAVICLGLGIGSVFPLTLILTLDHARQATQAGVLAAFVQGVGYMIAGAMPLLAGVLRDRLGNFDAAWIAMLAILLAALPLVMRFSPASARRYDGAHPAIIAA
jgi:CP family cyanate transporter-like MFS transporter